MTFFGKHSSRRAQSVAASLMLAPMVMWLRIPLIAAEAQGSGTVGSETMRAISEKGAAMAEGMVAAQISLAHSAARFWPEVLTGQMPSLLSGAAVEHSIEAALRPSGRKVRANYKRLGGAGTKAR